MPLSNAKNLVIKISEKFHEIVQATYLFGRKKKRTENNIILVIAHNVKLYYSNSSFNPIL